MARTPLMRSLQQLAADYHEANRLHLPLHAIRERRAEQAERGLSRRQVLGAAAVLAGATLLPYRVVAPRQPKVTIVGGGIAGLTAALTLADRGVASTVYEYSSRIEDLGGRMHSNASYWADGQVSEWCGELIDTNHKTILSLCKRFNLQTTDLLAAQPNGSEDTYYLFGQYYPKSEADTDFKPVHKALQADAQAASYPTLYNLSTAGGRALDAMSLYDWIESRVPGGHRSPMGMLLDLAYVIEYGADSTLQSALNLVYLLSDQAKPGNFAMFGASDERFHIIGGNQQLPLAIAQSLGVGSTVQLGMRMQAIKLNADGRYTLTFSSRDSSTEVVADYVILALPFAVLRTLDYSKAGFDPLKNTAIQQLGRGHNGKLQLQFGSRYWYGPGPWPGGRSNGNTYADTAYQNTWEVSRGQAGVSGLLVDYTGGSASTAMRTRRPFATIKQSHQVYQDAADFLHRIEPVYPGLAGTWRGLATSSLPHLAPNLNCSYSYWAVGQYQLFSGYEKARQGNVFFAGEHTSQDFQGYMEGGASEGIRAGTEVLIALGYHTTASPLRSRGNWLGLRRG
jgi:monoamine oxidase